MALVFDDRNLLPPGVHEATLDEVEACFARFQRSDRRIRLFEKLKLFLNDLATTFPAVEVIVNGSFVMPCVDEPGDIDLLVLLPQHVDLTGEFSPHEYNLISKRRIRQEFGSDGRSTNKGSLHEIEWIEFFCQVSPRWRLHFGWPPRSAKGIVRIRP